MRRYVTPTIVICFTVLFIAFMGVYLWLNGKGYNPNQFMLYVSQVPAVVIGILTLLKMVKVEKKVEVVEEQTNGALVAKLAAQTEELKSHVETVVTEGNNANTNDH